MMVIFVTLKFDFCLNGNTSNSRASKQIRIGNICKSHLNVTLMSQQPIHKIHQWTLPFLSHNTFFSHIIFIFLSKSGSYWKYRRHSKVNQFKAATFPILFWLLLSSIQAMTTNWVKKWNLHGWFFLFYFIPSLAVCRLLFQSIYALVFFLNSFASEKCFNISFLHGFCFKLDFVVVGFMGELKFLLINSN